MSQVNLISIIHTSFTPEDISLIYRYTEHASIIQCAMQQRPLVLNSANAIGTLESSHMQDSNLANPKQYREFEYFIYLSRSSFTT